MYFEEPYGVLDLQFALGQFNLFNTTILQTEISKVHARNVRCKLENLKRVFQEGRTNMVFHRKLNFYGD
jgi:hypothetical protein